MARVFISCGQRDKEREVAAQVSEKLRDKLKLLPLPYVATQTQSLDGFLHLIDELEASDYYVFIDFFCTDKGTRSWPWRFAPAFRTTRSSSCSSKDSSRTVS